MLAAVPVERYQRELRLFAAACARRVWHLLPPESHACVELSERFANGLASAEELDSAMDVASEVDRAYWSGACAPDARAYAEGGAGVSMPITTASVQSAASCICSAVACAAAAPCDGADYDRVHAATWLAECVEQAKLLRTFIPFPFK